MNISTTDQAKELLTILKNKHGNHLIFHLSGGCCEGSVPMCYILDDFKIGDIDIKIGHIEGCPFYISKHQYEIWKNTKHILIDAVKGRGSGFSLEIPEGMRFIIHSTL